MSAVPCVALLLYVYKWKASRALGMQLQEGVLFMDKCALLSSCELTLRLPQKLSPRMQK